MTQPVSWKETKARVDRMKEIYSADTYRSSDKLGELMGFGSLVFLDPLEKGDLFLPFSIGERTFCFALS